MVDFTHAGYLDLLGFITSLGRPIVSFDQIPSSGPYVILRHDIDFSLQNAVRMAELDRQANATSTFFVLLTSPYYNPLSFAGAAMVREIASMGHQCGLHYDCTGFELLSSEQRLNRVDCLAKTLEDVTGVPIRAIAQHKPASSPIRQEFPAYLDAYSVPFFKAIGYISDSRRRFVVPDVREFFRSHDRAQMLIHPLWWKEVDQTRANVFRGLENDAMDVLRGQLSEEEGAIEKFLSKQPPMIAAIPKGDNA
jgi:hypothetical protein